MGAPLPQALADLGDPPHSVTDPERTRLLRGLWKHYESRSLIKDGAPVSLPSHCPRASECWHVLEKPSGRGPRLGIQVPWIGPRYQQAKVLVLAINMHGSGWRGSPTQWFVVREVLSFYLGGDDPGYPLRFQKGVTGAVHAVLRSLQGLDSVTPPTKAERAEVLEACALLEAVKCQTEEDPPPAMWENCPEQAGLRREIEILDPQVLLVFGAGPRNSLRDLGLPGRWLSGPFRKVASELNDHPLPVFCLYHTSARVTGGWDRKVLGSLHRSLRRQPLTARDAS